MTFNVLLTGYARHEALHTSLVIALSFHTALIAVGYLTLRRQGISNQPDMQLTNDLIQGTFAPRSGRRHPADSRDQRLALLSRDYKQTIQRRLASDLQFKEALARELAECGDKLPISLDTFLPPVSHRHVPKLLVRLGRKASKAALMSKDRRQAMQARIKKYLQGPRVHKCDEEPALVREFGADHSRDPVQR